MTDVGAGPSKLVPCLAFAVGLCNQGKSMGSTVSVIMAAWNVGRYVDAAIQSVLTQTYPVLEVIVVDDGSTDETLQQLRCLAASDHRMRVLTQPNQGFAAARNRAVREARGEWIAVADADDVQLPDRIESQFRAIEAAPETSVCGGGVEVWDGGAGPGPRAFQPPDDVDIRAGMVFETPIFDPTALYRSSLVPPGGSMYSPLYRMAADYDLWARLAPSARYMNLPKVLTRYRQHPGQVTRISRQTGTGLEERKRVWGRMLREHFDIVPTESELNIHGVVAAWVHPLSPEQFDASIHWIRRLQSANRRLGRLEHRAWEALLARKWFWVHRHASRLDASSMRRYLASPLAWNAAVGWGPKLRLLGRIRGLRRKGI